MDFAVLNHTIIMCSTHTQLPLQFKAYGIATINTSRTHGLYYRRVKPLYCEIHLILPTSFDSVCLSEALLSVTVSACIMRFHTLNIVTLEVIYYQGQQETAALSRHSDPTSTL